MNEVYVLMGQENGWGTESFCIGVYSTNEKAKAIMPKAEEIFPNHTIWIEPTIIDDFNWEVVKNE